MRALLCAGAVMQDNCFAHHCCMPPRLDFQATTLLSIFLAIALLSCPVGMETATRAAAAGGVTTVVDMPLNSAPCTTTPAELARKLAAVRQPNHTCGGGAGNGLPSAVQPPNSIGAT